MVNIRTVERMINDQWVVCGFSELRINDVFRLFDNGVLFIDHKGKTEFLAISDPYKNEDEIWQVDIAS